MSDPFLGQIIPVGFNFAPRGWFLCEGQLLAISNYTALFSLLGTTFGGDGRTTFGLPDLRGRAIVGVGAGPGLSDIRWGERGGSQTHTLTTAQMPSHNHLGQIQTINAEGDESSPIGANGLANASNDLYAESPNNNTALGSVVLQNVGGGQSFGILNPYLGIYMCIARVGVYPSRS